MPSTKTRPSDAMLDALRAFGLQYPGAHTKSPWPGHLDLAVDGKTFAYLSVPGEPFVLSCKLPNTAEMALTLPHTKPTSYGLGHSGWVTAEYPDDQLPPMSLLTSWLDESYRAQAPKKLVSKLETAGIKLKTATKVISMAAKTTKAAPVRVSKSEAAPAPKATAVKASAAVKAASAATSAKKKAKSAPAPKREPGRSKAVVAVKAPKRAKTLVNTSTSARKTKPTKKR